MKNNCASLKHMFIFHSLYFKIIWYHKIRTWINVINLENAIEMVIISNDIYRRTNEVESNYHTYEIKVISFF